jgi:hypothetical protein
MMARLQRAQNPIVLTVILIFLISKARLLTVIELLTVLCRFQVLPIPRDIVAIAINTAVELILLLRPT